MHTDIIELSVGETRSATRGFSGDFSATDSARKMNNQPEEPSGTTKLVYDYRSRVTGITYPSLATNSFTYNGLDTRTSKTDSGGTKGFLRDGASVTDPVLSDGAATYTPGISESRSGVSTFYGQDQLGSVTLQTNTSGSITYKASYDAFGAIKSSTGSSASPFGFAGGPGYQQDSDSGLMLLGHRYYDSSTGRFLTRDPVKDGSNWYDYVGNNPLNGIDPLGLGFWGNLWSGAKKVAVVVGIVAGVVGIIVLSPVVAIGGGVLVLAVGLDDLWEDTSGAESSVDNYNKKMERQGLIQILYKH